METIRVIYNDSTKKIIEIFEGGTYNTATNYDAVQDTPNNCKIMLSALGFTEPELQKIDDFLAQSGA